MGGKVGLRCKGETLLGVVNQLFVQQDAYRVFKLDLSETKHLLGHQKCTFKLWKLYLYIYEMQNFDLWPLDLIEINIHVLHSLQQKKCQKSIK